jgi:carbon-monoxide dehydrogenase catalytic subunit
MIARAQKLGIDTVFDRAAQMKPCAIGIQGICCKNCAMGPCRLPLPKGGIEGEDTRKGLCGATANTIAARNFIRMIAGGAAAHSDHGRCVAEVFMSAARKETDATKSRTPKAVADRPLPWMWPPPSKWTVKSKTGHRRNRPGSGRKALNEWGKAEGELLYLKRARRRSTRNGKKPAWFRATSTVKSSKSCTAPTWAWTRTTKT